MIQRLDRLELRVPPLGLTVIFAILMAALVTSGIYRFTRNPMSLGFLLVLAGWSLYLAHWVAVLPLPAFVACMNRFRIRPEERPLQARFSPRFDQYTSAVRRWL